MDFGGLITIDGTVNSSSIHGGDAFSSSSSSSHADKRSGFLASAAEKLDWRSFKMAKSEAIPPPLPGREQFLGFSASKPAALLPTSSFIGNAGLSFGESDFGSNGLSAGGRGGVFTPSQWMELENQALIYKYIDANTEIPANLLSSTRRSFNPFGLSPGSLRSSQVDRGSYHAGLCGNGDPEPGRCRRTDGKKWRCSREAVADQKYCERHLNRGRHRSRKPVEGHINMSMMPTAAITTSRAASATTASRVSNNLTTAQQQQMTKFNSNRTTTLSDMKDSTCSKDSEELCKLTLLNSRTCAFPNPKQNQTDELSNVNFGFISTCSPSLQLGVNEQQQQQQQQQLQPHHALQQFTWSEGEGIKPDNYELPTPDGMSQRGASGMPFIWDKYAGGPLAEALKNTCKAQEHDKKSSLDLMIDSWDMSPWTGSSSTTFDSVSGTITSSSSKQKSIISMLSHDFS